MEVVKGNKKVVFDLDVVAGMEFNDFKASCLRSQPFKDMLPKDRQKKIKEVWSNANKRKAKTAKESKSGGNISSDNAGKGKQAVKPESESVKGWNNQSGQGDKAKV